MKRGQRGNGARAVTIWLNNAVLFTLLTAAALLSGSSMPPVDYHDEALETRGQQAQAYELSLVRERQRIAAAVGDRHCTKRNAGLATTGVIVQAFLEPTTWLYVPVDEVFADGWADRYLAVRLFCTS